MGRKWIKKIISASLIASMVLSTLPNLSGLPNCGKVGVEPKEVLAEVTGVNTVKNVFNSDEFHNDFVPSQNNDYVGVYEIKVDNDDTKGYVHSFKAENWSNIEQDVFAYQKIWLYKGWYKLDYTAGGFNEYTEGNTTVYPYINTKVSSESVTVTKNTIDSLQYDFEVETDGFYNVGCYVNAKSKSEVSVYNIELYCIYLEKRKY